MSRSDEYLPARLPSQKSGARVREALENPKRILVVDDKPQNRQLLWAILVPEGYDVVEASDGHEALAYLAQHPVDLVLLDIMMPTLDGFDTCRAIREDLGFVALPVIFVTALSDKLSRIRGQGVGADDFLSKPIDEIELLLRVRNLLRAKAYHDLQKENRARLAAELESLRRQLVHVERLATLGTLAGGVGHELNNILTVYLGALHFLRERAEQNLPPRERDIEQLVRVGDHIATHARHLLTLARPGPDYAERLDLREVIENTVTMLSVSGRTRRVSVTLDLPTEPLWVHLNRTRLEQALVNLIANAADATAEAIDREGLIVVRAVHGSRENDRGGGERVLCTVADNGCGVPEHQRENIFEAYFTTKAADAGTGLGLPVVKRIVEEYGGRLTLESTVGVGSTFTFDLPLESSPRSSTGLPSIDGGWEDITTPGFPIAGFPVPLEEFVPPRKHE